MKMKKIIVLDCETAPMDRDIAQVLPSNMAVYDVGWVVCDKKGNVEVTRSFINSDVFFGEPIMMDSAYYADKVPQYMEQIKNKESKVARLYTIRRQLLKDIEEYGVSEVYAHNARFDYGSLNNTQRFETKSKWRYFFPKSVTICDSMKMARDVIYTMPTYRKFCEENGFMTKHKTPRPQLKAETLYRFITKDVEFEEEHKGLQDVMIEKEIVAYCYRQHKKMRKKLFED